MSGSLSPATLRTAARLSNAFVLELVKLGGHGRDVLEPLLRTALLHANQSHIIRDPELALRFATLDDDVPDALRRPASVNAIANSLGIPFETARRRIGALVQAGVCVVTPDGIIVSGAATNSPPFRAACALQFEKLGVLYRGLRSIGALEAPGPPPRPFDGLDPPYRLAGRLTVEFVLRFNEPIIEYVKDVVSGLVLMELILANTEHLADGEAGAGRSSPDGILPDTLRRPVSVAALAQRTGIPAETVRRHVQRLVERGLCARRPHGYIIPAETLGRPRFAQAVLDNQKHLSRLFNGLAEFGVLALWEEQRVAAA